MAEFYIRKGSTLPVIIMKQVKNVEVNNEELYSKLENCAVTFSMVNVENGKYKIANKKAFLYRKEKMIDSAHPYEYFIYYKWTNKDTNSIGRYRGEFKIDFLDNCDESLIVPTNDELYINILESITKTTIVSL